MMLLFHVLIEHRTQQEKFNTLYYSFRQKLFYIAKSIVKNDTDAEDVLQEAFFKIAKHIEQVDDALGKRAFSFCAVITKNTALSFLKSQKTADPLEEIEYKVSDGNDVSDILC